jgi:hypothetical protein
MRVIPRARGGSVIVMTLPVPAGADVEKAAAVFEPRTGGVSKFWGVAAKNVILRSCAPPRSFAHFQQLEIGVERQFAKHSSPVDSRQWKRLTMGSRFSRIVRYCMAAGLLGQEPLCILGGDEANHAHCQQRPADTIEILVRLR